jgi:hypothetical protein
MIPIEIYPTVFGKNGYRGSYLANIAKYRLSSKETILNNRFFISIDKFSYQDSQSAKSQINNDHKIIYLERLSNLELIDKLPQIDNTILPTIGKIAYYRYIRSEISLDEYNNFLLHYRKDLIEMRLYIESLLKDGLDR